MTTAESISTLHAAERLWKPIPRPRQKAPTPQQSWRQLKDGQHLALRDTWFDGSHKWLAGQQFTVRAPTSKGVQLEPVLTTPDERGIIHSVPWSAPDWESLFERVRKGRTGRSK